MYPTDPEDQNQFDACDCPYCDSHFTECKCEFTTEEPLDFCTMCGEEFQHCECEWCRVCNDKLAVTSDGVCSECACKHPISKTAEKSCPVCGNWTHEDTSKWIHIDKLQERLIDRWVRLMTERYTYSVFQCCLDVKKLINEVKGENDEPQD